MNSEFVAPIVVAVLGVGSGAVTGYLAGRRQRLMEHEREAKLAAAQVAKALGVAAHIMSWLSWKAQHRTSLVASADVEEYDRDMKETFPDLVGALAVLASFSPDAYSTAKRVANQIYDLDERIALSGTGVLLKKEGAAEDLGRFLSEARRLEDHLNDVAGEIMAQVSYRTTNSLHRSP